MTALLTELKTRARILRNAKRKDAGAGTRADAPDSGEDLRLRDCLSRVARDAGFTHWDHARRVLGGLASTADDMGTFWHAPACNSLLNGWFTDLAHARAAQATERGAFLLPYKRQFMVVGSDFIFELALDPVDPAWAAARYDLAGSYGSAAWFALAQQRLKAPPRTFAPISDRKL
ncbi:MAG TPA: hypothetical protein VE934_11045 [Polaromonas sp.]|uniref:hypothetical protein n=1 Tax=Polaromonas sp. TaxID=1869339 RepID=UPI002D2AE58B|nr:hypothetical protein [Polaromonas sp.]HYW57490.1 hypothetical protein [Polaromonas sp.]